MFAISTKDIVINELREQLVNPAAGGFCAFEGWIRNENEGRSVERLEYEVYEPLAVSEGEKVIAEAKQLFPFLEATCVHRAGLLEIGDCAVWVGVSAAHRDEAFQACRYIIDQIKVRRPIWKKEHYVDGDSGWVNCERCANV
jgi:molybdopterin synthase catalytic subunit